MPARKNALRLIVSLAVFGLLLFAWLQRNAIYDWFRLYGYSPPAEVVQLADDTTMTDDSRHLFYVNKPAILDKVEFNASCPNNGGEQSIVLGCYHTRQTGIFLYDVDDPKLHGVKQVTAAHEALHAIYERLSGKERARIEGLLTNFYQNGLNDERVKKIINTYKITEPNDVVNEMHSIFATEIAVLPEELETYYKKFFINRKQIVNYASKYQKTFIDNQAKLTQIKVQIDTTKKQLDSLRSQIDTMETNLVNESRSLERQRDGVDAASAAAFNAQVESHNRAVQTYRGLISQFNNLIVEYNNLVEQYQAIAVETNQLYQELNSRSPTVTAQ
jgi:hypothetical protein